MDLAWDDGVVHIWKWDVDELVSSELQRVPPGLLVKACLVRTVQEMEQNYSLTTMQQLLAVLVTLPGAGHRASRQQSIVPGLWLWVSVFHSLAQATGRSLVPRTVRRDPGLVAF